MGAERNKLLLPLAGRPLLAWTLTAALASRSIAWIGLVGQERDRSDVDAILQSLDLAIPVRWVQGGDSRQVSVACGLAALAAGDRGGPRPRVNSWAGPLGGPGLKLDSGHSKSL